MGGAAGKRAGATIIGRFIGSLFGQKELGGVIGSLAGTLLFRDENKTVQRIGQSLADQPTTVSEYGQPLGEFAGTSRHGLNVIWSSKPYPEVTRTESGGKGGGDEVVTEIVRNFVDILCVASTCPLSPAGDVLQITRQGDLIFDQKSGNGADNPLADRLEVTFFGGAPDQEPWDVIESYEGVGNTPAYRYKVTIGLRHLEVTAAPVFVQGLQAVVNSGPRTDEQLDLTTGSAPPLGADPNRIVADFDRGFLYAGSDGFANINQYSLADGSFIRSLDPDFDTDVSLVGLDPDSGDVIFLDGLFDAVRIDNLAGAEQVRFTNASPVLVASVHSISVTLSSPAGQRGILAQNDGGNTWNFFSLETLAFGVGRTDGTVATGGGAGPAGAGFGYVTYQSSSEFIIVKFGLVPTIEPLTGLPTTELQFSELDRIAPSEVNPSATTYTLLGSRVFVDGATQRIIFGAQTDVGAFLVGYEEDVGVIWSTLVPNLNASLAGAGSQRIAGQAAYATDTGADLLVRVSTASGALSNPPLDGSVPGYGEPEVVPDEHIYDDATNRIYYIRGDSSLGFLTLSGRPAAESSVANIIEQRAFRAGIDAYSRDVKIDPDLYGTTVSGFECTPPYSGAAAIRNLAALLQFDGRQSGSRLEFLLRGGETVADLDYKDFIVANDQEDAYAIDRAEEAETPEIVAIRHRDPDRDYLTSLAMDKRPIAPFRVGASARAVTLDFNGAIPVATAKRAAQKIALELEIGRETVKAVLGPEFDHLDAADPVSVTLMDRVQRMRITENPQGADDTIRAALVREEPGQFTSVIEADGGSGPILTPTIVGSSELFLLSIPYLRDADNPGSSMLRLYVAGSTFASEWPGAAFIGGEAGAPLSGILGLLTPAAFGRAENALADVVDFTSLDTTNTLTVQMGFGADQIESISSGELAAGGNVFALIKANGQAEIAQFMTATALGSNRFELSDLLRYRRGTDVLGLGHSAGDRFVLLTTDSVRAFSLPFTSLNVGRTYKLVTNGQRVDAARPVSFASPGYDLKPYSLLNITATINGDGDIEIAADRRTRIGGDSIGGPAGGAIPLGEAFELYRADFFDSSDPTTENRTDAVNGSTPRTSETLPFVYTAAQYAADFGTSIPAPPFTLILRLRQVGGPVGSPIDGFFREVQLIVGGAIDGSETTQLGVTGGPGIPLGPFA